MRRSGPSLTLSPGLNPADSPSISPVLAPKRKEKKIQYWTAGRPPWYQVDGTIGEPFVIGVAGGTSSGKTTVCYKIVETLNIPWAVILSQDSFYKDLEGEDLERAKRNEYNFDHPDAFDYELMVQTLRDLKQGKRVQIPIYDFTTHKRRKAKQHIYGADVVLFEGILVFWSKELLDLMDLKIFVHTDSDIRLARRLRRDIAERGRDFNGVLEQYERFVKPAFDDYIAPTKKHANIIIPNGSDNSVAIDLIAEHIRSKINRQGEGGIRQQILTKAIQSQMPDTLVLLPSNAQITGMHTILRCRSTPREEFIFTATRLSRLLIEHALTLFPYDEFQVTTPTGSTYNGFHQNIELCGVSIMRAGESMEVALREVCKDVTIGKLLIQTDSKTGSPTLIYAKLPRDINQCYILLMDPLIGTGATAMMAVRVLLDHGVPEDRILFLTLIAAPQGVHTLAYAFPQVKIISTAVDKKVNAHFFVLPGVGNFGDRYFGTE